MYVHLQMLVLAHVVRTVLIYGSGIAGAEVACHHGHGLLVALHQLCLCGVGHSADARRQYVVDRSLVIVLLYVDSTYFQGGILCRCLTCVESLFVGAPVPMYQVQGGQTQDDVLLESCKEHAHETYAGKVLYVAHLLLITAQGNAEQIPGTLFRVSVAQFHACRTFVGDMVSSHHHIFGTYAYVVLIIFFVFVECIVLVDVFHVGCTLPCRLICFGVGVGVGTIALWHIYTLVSVEDGGLLAVEIRTSVIVVVVIGRVGLYAVIDLLIDHALYLLQVIGISGELPFLVIVQSIQSHILACSCSALVVEGISHAGGVGDSSPQAFGIIGAIAIHGHSALEVFLAVLEYVLAHFAQVDVEVSPVIAWQILLVYERIHHPEFDVFDVLGFEIRIVQFAHHTSPFLCGVLEMS